MITDNILSISDLEDFEGIKVLIEMANELCKESVLMEYSDVYMESDGDPTPSPTPQSTPDPDPLRSRSSSKQSTPPASTKKQSKKTETSDQDVSGKKPSKIKNVGNKIKAFIDRIWSIIQGFFDRIKNLFSSAKRKVRDRRVKKIATQIQELEKNGVDLSEYGPSGSEKGSGSTVTESAYYAEGGSVPGAQHDQPIIDRLTKRGLFQKKGFKTGLSLSKLVKCKNEIKKELAQIEQVFNDIDNKFDNPSQLKLECEKHTKAITSTVDILRSEAIYQNIKDVAEKFKPTPKTFDPEVEYRMRVNGQKIKRSDRALWKAQKKQDKINAKSDRVREKEFKKRLAYFDSDSIEYSGFPEYYGQVNEIIDDLTSTLTPFYNKFKNLKVKISKEIDFLSSDNNYIVKKYGKDIINDKKIEAMESCKNILESAMTITRDVATAMIEVLNVLDTNMEILTYTLENVPPKFKVRIRITREAY